MTARSGDADATSVDDPLADACHRCGESIYDDRMIRLSSEPCPALDDRYEAVTRSYCPDCVAGIGMLAVATDPGTRSPTEAE